jgi:hypothetical protein
MLPYIPYMDPMGIQFIAPANPISSSFLVGQGTMESGGQTNLVIGRELSGCLVSTVSTAQRSFRMKYWLVKNGIPQLILKMGIMMVNYPIKKGDYDGL